MNDIDRDRLVDRHLSALMDLQPPQQEAYLDEACRGDTSLRRELEELLVHIDGEKTDALVTGGGFEVVSDSSAAGERPRLLRETPAVIADRYEIRGELGAGGMGRVFEAWDRRLDRAVALKSFHSPDSRAQERLWREARSAAKIHHPRICQVFDVVESDGRVWVAMELLEGATLDEQIRSEPLDLDRALRIALEILEALEVIHSQGLVHRDIKPSNIFLTQHGIRLVDFGLAVPTEGADPLTRTGALVGSPRYIAPEIWRGGEATPRSDLFACGALIYEILSGRPAFEGSSPPAICLQILHRSPPGLAGGAGVERVDRVIRRALRKNPAHRFESAAAMKAALEKLHFETASHSVAASVQAITRVAVVPFRVLRPDPEIDFLAEGLPDTITSMLASTPHLVVRSMAHLPSGGDLSEDSLARLEVDAIFSGTLLRSGSTVRCRAQLVEVPAGTIMGTVVADREVGDVFELQDVLARRIVDALPLPGLETTVRPAVNPRAQRLLIQANRLAIDPSSAARTDEAVALYERALEEDAESPEAWARLARLHRIRGKYRLAPSVGSHRAARKAFDRALALDADLPLTHRLYTFYEVEDLRRAPEAMTRLLNRLRRSSTEPDLWAALVVAARFCGQLETSVAAADEAQRLDPTVPTGVAYTHFFRRDWARVLSEKPDHFPVPLWETLLETGREEEVLQMCRQRLEKTKASYGESFVQALIASVEGRPDVVCDALPGLEAFPDPEGIYFSARLLVRAGAVEEGLRFGARAVEKGLWIPEAFENDTLFRAYLEAPVLKKALARCRTESQRARELFVEAGGPELLGSSAGHVPAE